MSTPTMRTRTLPERLAILRAEARALLAEISDPFETRVSAIPERPE
jgi:hypothetical protein